MLTTKMMEILDPMVAEIKSKCYGSSDYLSGINDGAYTIGQDLLLKLEKAFIVGFMNKPEFNPTCVDEIADGRLTAAWNAFMKNWNNYTPTLNSNTNGE